MNKQEAKKLETLVFEKLSHINKGTTVIVGISGGADSVFLLHLLDRLNINIVVGHINHQLRGEESEKDEKFIENLVVELNDNRPKSYTKIVSESIKKDVRALSEKQQKGLEETGRDIRYEYLKKLAKKHKAKYILTAHHADDNLETMLLNFTRGASLAGLSGISELQIITAETMLYRPLLGVTKNQISSYLELHKIDFRFDESNLDRLYKRNLIRHEVIPKLKELNPNLSQTASKNSKNLREIDDLLLHEAKKWLQQCNIDRKPVKLIEIPAQTLRNEPVSLQKTIMRELYRTIVGDTNNLESIHIDEVLELINKNVGNKSKKFGETTVKINKNTIILSINN